MLRKPQLLLLFFIALVTWGVAQAQSGRRSTPASTAPTTAPSSAKTAEKKSAAESRLQLLVGINRAGSFTITPYYVYDTVLADCTKRLGDAETVFVNSGGFSMNRSAAVKAARDETTRWVVSLEVKSLFAESGQKIKPEQDELFVEYTVVEPVTGKIKHSGRTQRHIYQSGNSRSAEKGGPNYSDYSIKQAAVEAAEKILAGFDIKLRD